MSQFEHFKPTDVFLMLARRGCGKTFLARKISALYPRRVIFDPLFDYSPADGTLVTSFQEFSAAILAVKDAASFSIVFQPTPERAYDEEFNQAMRVLWYMGDVLIHIEEVQLFAPTYAVPHWFKQVVFTGRHQNLAVICTSLRPGDCSKALISQAGHIFIGSLHEKNDLLYARSILGEQVGMLPHLRDRVFYYYRPAKPLTLVKNDLTILPHCKKELTIPLESTEIEIDTTDLGSGA